MVFAIILRTCLGNFIMLYRLVIQNYAIIENLEVDFSVGTST